MCPQWNNCQLQKIVSIYEIYVVFIYVLLIWTFLVFPYWMSPSLKISSYENQPIFIFQIWTTTRIRIQRWIWQIPTVTTLSGGNGMLWLLMFKVDQMKKHLQKRRMVMKIQFLCPKIVCARPVGKLCLYVVMESVFGLGRYVQYSGSVTFWYGFGSVLQTNGSGFGS